MITHIKVEKIVLSKNYLHEKIYTPIDITNQVSCPIVDSQRLDDVLDTTSVILYNNLEDALRPFTRIKITLTDTVEGIDQESCLYRFVESDNVTNICLGNEPIYKHTLNLIEITKMLERVAVDNLTFTNYTDESYGTDTAVSFTYGVEGSVRSGSNSMLLAVSVGNNKYKAQMQPVEYTSNSARYIGPYKILQQACYDVCASTVAGALEVIADGGTPTDSQICLSDATPKEIGKVISVGDYVYWNNKVAENTIATNIEMSVKITYYTSPICSLFGWLMQTSTGTRTSYYVEEPDGARVNLTSSSNYTFTKTGTHTFVQVYECLGKVVTFYWNITSVANIASVPQKYTVAEVINRLLRVCNLRRKEIDNQEFFIDEDVENVLDVSLSPEFSFTQGTLFEALSTIGGYIHAIPRLIPRQKIIYEFDASQGVEVARLDDYSEWNIITFDFLGGTTQFNEDNYSLLDAQHSIENLATNYVTNIQNATQSNYNGSTTVVEPFLNGYISTRTESTNFEISNNEAIIKTTKPIRTLLGLYCYTGGRKVDITSYVVEKAKYDILSSYTDGNSSIGNKAFYLCYTKKSKNITGLTYKRENQTFLNGFVNNIAIKNILGIDQSVSIEGSIKNLAFQIKYIPYQNMKARQYKSLIEESAEDCASFFNQQSNEVDIESYGEQLKGILLKTGEQTVAETQYFNNLADSPNIGMVSNDNYYAFAVNKEITTFAPIKTTTEWSNNYNKLNEYTSVKKNIRQYEISEDESINRNLDYQEFCIVDTSLDVGSVFESISEEMAEYLEQSGTTLAQVKAEVEQKLSAVGFGSQALLAQLASKLKNEEINYKAISYSIIKTIGLSRDGNTENHSFLLPVACCPFGNSVIMNFNTDDNYSANTYSVEPSDVNETGINRINGNYNLEEFIKYGNEFGRFDTMKVAFGSDSPIQNFNSNIVAKAKQLYKIEESEINESDLLVDFRNNDFIVEKDSREQISLTVQLNFVTPNKKVLIGNGLVHTMPITGDISTTYRYVIFSQKPNKLKEKVDIATVHDNTETRTLTIENQSNIKTLKINNISACTNGVGYGIIDNNNRLCVYVDEPITQGSQTKAIYLMFRRKV